MTQLIACKIRVPTFGDYGIGHSDHVLPMDMRLLKPSAKIKYTISDDWMIVKGRNIRDYKFEQYRDLCRTIINSQNFSGEKFSRGDQFIADCAVNNGSLGNMATWVNVGTNHHIEKVVFDLSNLFSP